MSKKIMIVEDDEFFHILYGLVIEDTGYRVINAYDGEDALYKLEEEKPDLIILDMVLDMMTGDTFFLYLKGMPEFADIPVIIVSNYHWKKYKNLKGLDPKLFFLGKNCIGEKLVSEVKARIE